MAFYEPTKAEQCRRKGPDGQDQALCCSCDRWLNVLHYSGLKASTRVFRCKTCVLERYKTKQKAKLAVPAARLGFSLRARERRYGMPTKISAKQIGEIFSKYNKTCVVTGRTSSDGVKMTLVRFDRERPLAVDNAVLVSACGVGIRSMHDPSFKWPPEAKQKIEAVLASKTSLI